MKDKVEISVEDFLMEIKLLFGGNAQRVSGGMNQELVVVPVQVAERVVRLCDMFLGLTGAGGVPQL